VPPSSFLLLPTAVLLVFHQRRQQHTQTILKEAQNDHRKGTVERKKKSNQKIIKQCISVARRRGEDGFEIRHHTGFQC
jgi:hypothetical protein